MAPPPPPTFNCLIIGNPGTGKTTLMKRMLCKGFDETHEPTTEPVLNAFTFRISRIRDRKRIRLHCYEYPMREGFNDKFFKENDCGKMDCAIIMCDVNDESTMKDVDEWIQVFLRYGKDIPIAVCGNKADLLDPEKDYKDYICKSNNVMWAPGSVKRLNGLWVPFCHLAEMLVGFHECRGLPGYFIDYMAGKGLRGF